MKNLVKTSLAGLSGVILGLVTYYFFYGWYNIFPWAIAALVIGYFSVSRKDSMLNGSFFGYFLFLVYIFAGYKGKTDVGTLIRFVGFDMLFSLVGAIAGSVGAFIGYFFKGKFGGVKRV